MRNFFRYILDLFPRYASTYRQIRDQLDKKSPPILTPWGFTLAGSPLMASGRFEKNETLLIRKLLSDVDLFVNVGANIGYYCCHALSLNKFVIAIEPVQRNLHYLLKNIKNNSWESKCDVFPVAVGESTNILNIWGGGTGASLLKGWASIPDSYVTQVPVISLDRLLSGAIEGKKTLIMIDIEGAELMLLKGAVNTLANDVRPIWIVEINSTEHQPGSTTFNPNFYSTFDIFFKNGYKSFMVNESLNEINCDNLIDFSKNSEFTNVQNFLFM